MDGLALLLGILTFICILVIIGLNLINIYQKVEEGFAEQKETASPIELKIKAIISPMIVPEICPLFKSIRDTSFKNEKTGSSLSDAEIKKKVEDGLALKIPGGALPCPLVVYPRPGSTDLDWLDFLQKFPKDFGARIVFMAIYAKEFLGTTETTLKAALSGNGTPPIPDTESFTVCTPDLATSRRAEQAKKPAESCVLPEDLSPQQIDTAVTELLKDIVANKSTLLKEKKIDPKINIGFEENFTIFNMIDNTKNIKNLINEKKSLEEIETNGNDCYL
jgi:hypothetical protein